jgi:hypothetical protein
MRLVQSAVLVADGRESERAVEVRASRESELDAVAELEREKAVSD